jgi:hypothetical protein
VPCLGLVLLIGSAGHEVISAATIGCGASRLARRTKRRQRVNRPFSRSNACFLNPSCFTRPMWYSFSST